jgi:murein DD-endopeptidase MepM/ murein hydrolase activator NlpD
MWGVCQTCRVRISSGLGWRLAVSVAVAGVLTMGSAVPAVSADDGARRRTPAASSAKPASAHAAKIKRFWVKDKHFYRSRWYAGKHRKMVPFGCTKAPYYDPSPLCPDDEGFHHGLDIAMDCGTKLFAGLRGTIVRPDSPGALGPAYGPYAFRIRNQRLDLDFVIGHVKKVYVEPGDHVRRGDLIARASDQGAPDGCHLHFEARPKGDSYEAAVSPTRYLHLHRVHHR